MEFIACSTDNYRVGRVRAGSSGLIHIYTGEEDEWA